MNNEKKFPECNILGVNVNVVTMKEVIDFIEKEIEQLRGRYICVSNVHTTVMAYEDKNYLNIQNRASLVLPDGKPLSIISKLKGFLKAERVTGPDLMGELFGRNNKINHFFYGSTEETLTAMKEHLINKYPHMRIVGTYSPPFGNISKKEEEEIGNLIKNSETDIIWVGLGAPKQEKWMYENRGKYDALMIGVGAGFDYYAQKIKRAPKWMQQCSLEWLYRLIQEPKRLWKRYLTTNIKFVWYIILESIRRGTK